MVIELIFQALLLSAFLGLLGVFLFIWLNASEAELDEKSTEGRFDPSREIAQQYQMKQSDWEEDPEQSLKAYDQAARKRRATQTNLRVIGTPEDGRSSVDCSEDAVDIESNSGLPYLDKTA